MREMGRGSREEGTIFLYSPYSGTYHFNQCDLPFLSPIGSTLNCEKAHQVNMEICLAFLARHLLKGTLAVVDFFCIRSILITACWSNKVITLPMPYQGLIYSFGEEGMQLP